jgi:hypothetical protein
MGQTRWEVVDVDGRKYRGAHSHTVVGAKGACREERTGTRSVLVGQTKEESACSVYGQWRPMACGAANAAVFARPNKKYRCGAGRDAAAHKTHASCDAHAIRNSYNPKLKLFVTDVYVRSSCQEAALFVAARTRTHMKRMTARVCVPKRAERCLVRQKKASLKYRAIKVVARLSFVCCSSSTSHVSTRQPP